MKRAFSRRIVVGTVAKSIGVLMLGSAAGGVLTACGAQAPAAPTAPAPEAKPATQAPGKREMRSIKFSLAWIPTGEMAFFYAAKKFGYWQQGGLDVDIQRGYGSGTAAKQTGLGQFDFAQADMGAGLNVIVGGLDIVSVGVTSPKHPGGVFSLKKANITKPKDLEGRSIGNTSGSATESMLEAFMAANGVDKSKVKKVNLAGDVLVPAMLKGEVDATANFFQNAAPDLIVDKIPYNVMLFADYGLNIYSVAIFTTRKMLKEQPEVVETFVGGAMEGLKYSYLEPDKANDIFLEMVPEAGQAARDKETNRLSLLVNNAMGMVPSFEERGLGYHDPQIMNKTIDILAEFLQWKQKPNADAVTTNQFVGKVKLTAAEWDKARSQAKDFLTLKAN